MDRNQLRNNFKELITLEVNGKPKALWGLIKPARDKRLQWQCDQDYIDKLDDKALVFLNAFNLATIDGNFSNLEEIGFHTSNDFKRDVYNSRNAAQRDYVSNNQAAQIELNDFINPSSTLSLGEALDSIRQAKKKARKAKRGS